MSYGAQARAYTEAAVMSSTPEQLVPLLYQHLLAALQRAEVQIRERDYEGKANSLSRASDILYELLATLNFEAGGEIAPRLSALYTYMIGEIGAASRTLEVERLRRVATMVDTLGQAWAQAARETALG